MEDQKNEEEKEVGVYLSEFCSHLLEPHRNGCGTMDNYRWTPF